MKLSAQQQLVIDYVAGALVAGTAYCPTPAMRRTVHSLTHKGLIEFVARPSRGYRYEVTEKGKQHVSRPYYRGFVVASTELTHVKMTSGNEKRYPKVIDNDIVKTWVGIGWVDGGGPTIGERNTLARVIWTETSKQSTGYKNRQ